MPALERLGWRSCVRALYVLLLLCSLPAAASAEPIVGSEVLANTENAVFLTNGRYFVAGSAGVHEIKRAPDERQGCWTDRMKGLTVCTVLRPELNGDVCLYSGLTTDGEQLYAACTVTGDSVLGALFPPKAALIRIRPNGQSFDFTTTYFAEPTWYNGMAMMDGDTLLLTRSLTGALTNGAGAAIDRVDIVDSRTLELRVRPWLAASSSYLLPNGIVVEDGYVYFIGGQNLFRIQVRADGSAGASTLLHQTPINHTFDDMTIAGDYLAVAEIAIVNGLGVNSITLVRKTGSLFPRRIPSNEIQLSSLAVDPGSFGSRGNLIATSFFQGGIHSFPKPR